MKMKKPLVAIACIALLGTAPFAFAGGDAAAGKAKAGPCVNCHGAHGEGKKAAEEGKKPNPPIAGKKEAEFVQALEEYKSGKRDSSAMKMFAKKLSTEDMANLAAYYASLK
jgi:cytochrome c553